MKDKILIIEDDLELQEVLWLHLKHAGYEVHCSANGQEGFEKIRELRPDLVLLDLMLPLVPGMEVLRRMAADPELKDTAVIVMTAYGDPEGILEKMVFDRGAKEYIEKPFRSPEILSLVRKTLLRARAVSEPATPPPQRPLSSPSVLEDSR